jgi:hypothetical protein
VAILFLISIPPAAYASFTGDPAAPSPLVYIPLFPLLFLTLTGTYLLVRPWFDAWRGRRTPQQTLDATEPTA